MSFELYCRRGHQKRDTNMEIRSIVYYFFSDVYPRINGGSRPLDPPEFWRRLFSARPPPVAPVPAVVQNNWAEPVGI